MITWRWPPFCDRLSWPTNCIFMIQCKFGEKSRQVSLFASQRILTSLVIPVSTFSLRVYGRSSFLPILSPYLVFCPSYLIISHLSRWWKKEAWLWEGAPPSVMSCHGFPGLREILVRNRNRHPTFATRCHGRRIFTSHSPSCLISFFPHAWSIL